MKKFLWITVIFAAAAAIVYISAPAGKFNASFFNFSSTGGGFEDYFDDVAKEISGNQYLAAPAVFTVSTFINAYDSGNDMSGLIETEIRNSLSQAMPGRVTVYRHFKKAEEKKAEKNLPEKNKKQNNAKNNAKKAADAAADKTENKNTEEPASDTDSLINHSGNFVVSGTYKEDDSSIIINLYVADAENGRGYYARRIEIPMDKLPMLFIKKPVLPQAAHENIIKTEEMPQAEKNAAVFDNKINASNTENKANKALKTSNKAEKENKKAAKETKPLSKPADAANAGSNAEAANNSDESNASSQADNQESQQTDSPIESDPLNEHNEPDYNAAVPL